MKLTVGERIKMFRVAKGMTQQDVARALGVSYQNISQYERGIRVPKMSMVRRLASALSVDAWEIAGFDPAVEVDVPPPVDMPARASGKRHDELIAYFDKLNTTGQLRAIEMLADLAEIHKYCEKGAE